MIKKIFLNCFLLLLWPAFGLAATSDFTVRTIVGPDTQPPTTPTLLSAVPVTTAQIDLAWTASTDNFLMGGYVVLRDSVPIATTTLTSFNDTGLVDDTTYTYEVYAFDSFFNLSSTSNSLSATTLAFPLIPPTPTSTAVSSGQKPSSRPLVLLDFSIVTTSQAAAFSWQTDLPSSYVLSWGKADVYDGYVASDIYRQIQKTTITDLEPATTYFYELVAKSPSGVTMTLSQGQFKTDDLKEITPPANVSRLQAEVSGADVFLSWQLPPSVDISAIRVVRSHLGFPIDTNDGLIVYEGLGMKVVDREALKHDSPQYYTVFVIGSDGLVSSGAVVSVSRGAIVLPPVLTPTATTTATTTIPIMSTTTEDVIIFGFDKNNINISQDGNNFTFLNDKIILNYKAPFTIKIPRDSLPRHLKAIVVTLIDPTDHRRSYSFLLRLNQEETYYEAIIAPLNILGASRLQVEIFDFERQIIGLYRKQIDFAATITEEPEVVFPDKIVASAGKTMPLLILGVLILFIMIFLWRRRNQAEDN